MHKSRNGLLHTNTKLSLKLSPRTHILNSITAFHRGIPTHCDPLQQVAVEQNLWRGSHAVVPSVHDSGQSVRTQCLWRI